MNNTFIQSCAVGDCETVENMLEGMNPNNAAAVVAGIDLMLAHSHSGLTDAFARWGQLHPRFGLATLSLAFLKGNLTVASFVLDHMLKPHLVNCSFGFLFHSGQDLPQSQRTEIAQLILKKSQTSSHGDFLSTVVNKGDEHLIDLVCAALPYITVEKNQDPKYIDLWPHFLLCSNAINFSGWGNEDNSHDPQRYRTILNKLLMHVDTCKLEHRLAFEALEEPEILENTAVLQECIQKHQRAVLEQAVHNTHPRESTARKI